MLRMCLLLLCLAQTASALSSHMNAAERGESLMSQVERMREQTAKVEEELSELDPDDTSSSVSRSDDFGAEQDSPRQQLPTSEQNTVTPPSEEPALPPMSGVDTDSSVSIQPEVPPVEHLVAPQTAKLKSATSAEKYFRPGLDGGKADNVEFGIRLKKWYGIDLLESTFSADAILTTRWRDDRTFKLLPQHAVTVRLSSEDAKTLMWLPDVQFTNIAHQPNVLSSSVLVNKNGSITNVQRMLITMKQVFPTKDFPFDEQTVAMKVASRVYMQDELMLTPTSDDALVRVSPDLFSNSGFYYVSSNLVSFLDDDGVLRKSRGVLSVTLKRSSSQFMSSIFIPSTILLFMSWCTLWFPFSSTFVMPRVASSVISVLCMISMLRQAMSLSPAASTWTWMSQYLELCLELQFLLMVCNALFLSLYHRNPPPKKGGHAQLTTNLADKLDNELIAVFPAFSVLVIGCGWGGYFWLSRCVLVTTTIAFSSYTIIVYRRYKAQLLQKDVERPEGEKVTLSREGSHSTTSVA